MNTSGGQGHSAIMTPIQRRLSLLTALAWVVALAACSGPAAEQPPPAEPLASVTAQGEDDLRTEQAVSETLRKAETAFMDGRWGDVVVDAGRVMRGLASPEEYYAAARLLGIASCKRKDTRPLHDVWLRLLPVDRERLRAECKDAGITLDDEGQVVAPAASAEDA